MNSSRFTSRSALRVYRAAFYGVVSAGALTALAACGSDAQTDDGVAGESAQGGGVQSGAPNGGGTAALAGTSGTVAGSNSGGSSGLAENGTAGAGYTSGGTASGGSVSGGTSGSGVSGSASGGTNAAGHGGTTGTGGTAGKGGTTGTGGTAGKGGTTGTGGTAGKGGTAGAGGAAGVSGGTAGAGGTTSAANKVFGQNRFHFGTIDSIAKNAGASMISQIDFFTSGWIQGDTFDHSGVCNDTKAGGALENKVPVLVAYISAAHVKRADNTMCDCNVTSGSCVASNDLCHHGAAQIKADFTAITNAYKSYSQGFAACYGTTKPIVFEMEPDWYQYTISSQSAPWTPAQAGTMLGQLVTALKSSLPNARFSIDVSPWVGSNGSDNGAAWYSNFDMSLFTFVNTSGGGTNANTVKIRSSNLMTWAGLSQVTGKPILADTGYGANGAAAGEDPLWNVAANINARMADGVVSISQYNPTSSWGNTVSGIRSQLNTPKFNP